MACTNRTLPILNNPTKNEKALWTWLSQGCLDFGDPCIIPPILDSPNECELTLINAIIGGQCKTRACSLMLLFPPGCSSNLQALTLYVDDVINPVFVTPPALPPFVPPPCPTDDFERANSNTVANPPAQPWEEKETTTDTYRILNVPDGRLFFEGTPPFGVTPVKVGFMHFGGIGGGPVNWIADHSIDVGINGIRINPLSGSTERAAGIGVRITGTITNFFGYVLLRGVATGSNTGTLWRLQNVNLRRALTGQSGAVILLQSLAISVVTKLAIKGSSITITTNFGTFNVIDTQIISPGFGPGFVTQADETRTGVTGAQGQVRTVCLANE